MSDRSHVPLVNAVVNPTYESDIRSTLKFCRLFLQLIGVWPLVRGYKSRLDSLVAVVLMFVCVFTLAFMLIPCIYYPFFYVTDLNVMIKTFGPVSYYISCIVKYGYIGLRGSEFGRCIKQIETDWMSVDNRRHREIMLKNVIVARKLIMICATLLYGSCSVYHGILPTFSSSFVYNSSFRPVIYPGYHVFIDDQATPAYEIIYGMQFLYSLVSCSITSACCTLVVFFVTHACGQIQIQIDRLDYLVADKLNRKGGKSNLLGIIVRDHVKAVRFSNNIAVLLSEICFMEILLSTMLICSLEYLCIVEWKNRDMLAIGTYVGFIISFTFNMLILCYAGELLVEQGGKIGEASYGIEWYNLSGKEGLELVLLIAISKYPPKLTGGKIFELSMDTFSNVLKSSVVYMNLCRAVTEW